MLPGQPKRRPGAQRAAGLLPKGKAQTQSRMSRLAAPYSAAAPPVFPLVCVQEHTRVGSANSQDIQLCGMAIQAQHCIIDVAESNRVVLSPLHNARCVQLSNSGKGGKGSPQDLQNLILRFSGFSSCQDTRQWYRSHQPGPASSRRPNLVGEQPLF